MRSALRHAFPWFLGGVFGLASAAAIMNQVKEMHPHQALLDVTHRAYVSVDCVHSQRALSAIEQARGPTELLVIPVDLTESAERTNVCERPLALLRESQGLLWRLVPDSFLCRRLAEEASDWLASFKVDGAIEVPAWANGPEVEAWGWTPWVRPLLERDGILLAEIEP